MHRAISLFMMPTIVQLIDPTLRPAQLLDRSNTTLAAQLSIRALGTNPIQIRLGVSKNLSLKKKNAKAH